MLKKQKVIQFWLILLIVGGLTSCMPKIEVVSEEPIIPTTILPQTISYQNQQARLQRELAQLEPQRKLSKQQFRPRIREIPRRPQRNLSQEVIEIPRRRQKNLSQEVINIPRRPQRKLSQEAIEIPRRRQRKLSQEVIEIPRRPQRKLSQEVIEIPRRPQRKLSQEVINYFPPARQPVKRFSSGNSLRSFFSSVNNLSSSYQPVNILHLGDSHTANDRFSGRLRQLFQRRFGSAGRGMLPVGEPFAYFRPSNVKVSQSRGWKVSNSFTAPRSGPYGLSGFRVRGSRPNQFITLKMTDGTRFDEVDIEFQRQPSNGTILVNIDGRIETEIITYGEQYIDHHTISVRGGGRRVKLFPKGDGPIELLSWTFRRNKAGVVYHSHGISGTTVNIINTWSRNVVSWEVGLLNPALIVVVYGTNEGFQNKLDLNKYARNFRARLALLRGSAPQASIVVVGPPDGNRLPRFCKKRKYVGCSPLTSYEINNYRQLLARKNQQLCRWHPPPKLHAVREIQRRISAQEGYFFWDWSKVMDGACGIHAWTKRGSASKDHVHLTKRGYRASANALFKDIMAQSRF